MLKKMIDKINEKKPSLTQNTLSQKETEEEFVTVDQKYRSQRNSSKWRRKQYKNHRIDNSDMEHGHRVKKLKQAGV